MSPQEHDTTAVGATPTGAETLFHRLGGVAVVRTAVEEFYQRLLGDEELSPFFDKTKMAILKQHQLEFFKLALTEIPPDLDVGAMLSERHDALFQKGLNADHFDLVANHFVATLTHLGVQPDMIDEAAGVILPLRSVFEEGAKKYADKVASEKEKENSATASATTSSSSDHVLHTPTTPNEPNLHDKLGGVSGLKVVVEDFYKRLLEDPELCPFFEDVNLTALKMHQVMFMKICFSQIPDDMDVGALMREKHQALFDEKGLNEKHFDMVVKHFAATLEAAPGISPELIAEAAAVITPLRGIFEQGALDANAAKA